MHNKSLLLRIGAISTALILIISILPFSALAADASVRDLYHGQILMPVSAYDYNGYSSLSYNHCTIYVDSVSGHAIYGTHDYNNNGIRFDEIQGPNPPNSRFEITSFEMPIQKRVRSSEARFFMDIGYTGILPNYAHKKYDFHFPVQLNYNNYYQDGKINVTFIVRSGSLILSETKFENIFVNSYRDFSMSGRGTFTYDAVGSCYLDELNAPYPGIKFLEFVVKTDWLSYHSNNNGGSIVLTQDGCLVQNHVFPSHPSDYEPEPGEDVPTEPLLRRFDSSWRYGLANEINGDNRSIYLSPYSGTVDYLYDKDGAGRHDPDNYGIWSRGNDVLRTSADWVDDRYTFTTQLLDIGYNKRNYRLQYNLTYKTPFNYKSGFASDNNDGSTAFYTRVSSFGTFNQTNAVLWWNKFTAPAVADYYYLSVDFSFGVYNYLSDGQLDLQVDYFFGNRRNRPEDLSAPTFTHTVTAINSQASNGFYHYMYSFGDDFKFGNVGVLSDAFYTGDIIIRPTIIWRSWNSSSAGTSVTLNSGGVVFTNHLPSQVGQIKDYSSLNSNMFDNYNFTMSNLYQELGVSVNTTNALFTDLKALMLPLSSSFSFVSSIFDRISQLSYMRLLLYFSLVLGVVAFLLFSFHPPASSKRSDDSNTHRSKSKGD